LKDKPAQTPANSTSSSGSGGVRFTTRLLGAGNGSRGLGFGGGNGFTGRLSGTSKSTAIPITGMSSSNGPMTSSFDGEGTYLIFNVGDALFISDYNSQDKASIYELLLNQVISIRIVRRLVIREVRSMSYWNAGIQFGMTYILCHGCNLYSHKIPVLTRYYALLEVPGFDYRELLIEL
jgi:hypothetical protein